MLAGETKQRSITHIEKGKNIFQKSWKRREKFLTNGKNGTRVIWTKREVMVEVYTVFAFFSLAKGMLRGHMIAAY